MVFIPKIEHILIITWSKLDHWLICIVHRSHRADSANDEISPNKDKNRSSWAETIEFTVNNVMLWLHNIKIQTKGAHRNHLVWTANQSFPPKGAQPMSGSTPWLGNLNSMFTALLLDGSLMQQCLLTLKHVLLMRKVPIVFSHPSSLDVLW